MTGINRTTQPIGQSRQYQENAVKCTSTLAYFQLQIRCSSHIEDKFSTGTTRIINNFPLSSCRQVTILYYISIPMLMNPCNVDRTNQGNQQDNQILYCRQRLATLTRVSRKQYTTISLYVQWPLTIHNSIVIANMTPIIDQLNLIGYFLFYFNTNIKLSSVLNICPTV